MAATTGTPVGASVGASVGDSLIEGVVFSENVFNFKHLIWLSSD